MNDPERSQNDPSARTVCALMLCSTWVLISSALGCGYFTTNPEPEAPPVRSQPGPTWAGDLSAASDGPLFRDDFEGRLDPAWVWQAEDASRHRITADGWLEITGGNESILTGGRQANLLWIPLPEGDFEVYIHMRSQPLFDFQRAGILLYRDAEHYVFWGQGHCMHCVLGGNGAFLEYNLDAQRGQYAAAFDGGDLYLMLIVERGAIHAFHAMHADQWQHLASLDYHLGFERAALSVTNDTSWNEGYNLVGMFDFFEIRRPTQPAPSSTPAPFPQG